MVVICQKCHEKTWNPIRQKIRKKGISYENIFYPHLDVDRRKKLSARLVKKCYVRSGRMKKEDVFTRFLDNQKGARKYQRASKGAVIQFDSD